jgi:hypothetical protein
MVKRVLTTIASSNPIPHKLAIKQMIHPGIPNPNPTFPLVLPIVEVKKIRFRIKLGIKNKVPRE